MQDVINKNYEDLAVAFCTEVSEEYRETYRKAMQTDDEEYRKGYLKACETIEKDMSRNKIWQAVTDIPFSTIAERIRKGE